MAADSADPTHPVGNDSGTMAATHSSAETAGTPEWRGNDRYKVVRRIGRGAVGAVYEAIDRERRDRRAQDPSQRISGVPLLVKQEFRTLADVHHPNLVQLYELVATNPERVFFAMELVDGKDLLAHVQGAGEGTNSERLRAALRQLVQGVQALHAAGKLHRDIKPSNVLCTAEGRVVLLDFGVATELPRMVDDNQVEEDQVVGTARYMAPEQALDEPPTPASDWYSVGVMLYEAGRRPAVRRIGNRSAYGQDDDGPGAAFRAR